MGIWMIQDFLRLQITVVPLGAPQTWPSNSIGVTNPNGRGSKWSPRNSMVPLVPSVPSQNSPNRYVFQNGFCLLLLWFPLLDCPGSPQRPEAPGRGSIGPLVRSPRPWPLPDFRQSSWNLKFNIWNLDLDGEEKGKKNLKYVSALVPWVMSANLHSTLPWDTLSIPVDMESLMNEAWSLVQDQRWWRLPLWGREFQLMQFVPRALFALGAKATGENRAVARSDRWDHAHSRTNVTARNQDHMCHMFRFLLRNSISLC